MRIYAKAVFLSLLCLVALVNDGRSSRSAASTLSSIQTLQRVRFDVDAFEEQGDRRNLLAKTTIEGLQGTDFQIKLQGKKFEMDARFLTDLVSPDALKIRAEMKTRRLYGYSERNLPLYEEDAQQQALQLSFDEKLVLLPFGSNDSSAELKIEITPSLSQQDAYLPSGKPRPLEIKIPKQAPGGAITVEASRVPHKFAVDAVLLENGREIARGATDNTLFNESKVITLTPIALATPELINNRIALDLNINEYIRSRPTDDVGIAFDVYSSDAQQPAELKPVGFHAAGIKELGSVFVYDLTGYYLKSSSKKYELRIAVKLAAGEQVD